MRAVCEIHYVCDVCESHYDTFGAALECEARGRIVAYPVGMVYRTGSRSHGVVAASACHHHEYALHIHQSTRLGEQQGSLEYYNLRRVTGTVLTEKEKAETAHESFLHAAGLYWQPGTISLPIWDGSQVVLHSIDPLPDFSYPIKPHPNVGIEATLCP